MRAIVYVRYFTSQKKTGTYIISSAKAVQENEHYARGTFTRWR
jgi:hypothetical protein